MITMSNFGKKGRLGNQLFQLASMIGISTQHKQEVILSEWKYAKYFNGIINTSAIPKGANVYKYKEANFHYTPFSFVSQNEVIDLDGYFQSELYWNGYKEEIKKLFSFKPGVIEAVKNKYAQALQKETIAISIRRGDYVDNPNYELLPVDYYFIALLENFPDWRNKNIIIFSDDIDYCKVHFSCFENVYYAENKFNNLDKTKYFDVNESAIEQLCLMSLCNHFIISNSTFAWWGAYLGEKQGTKIIRPAHFFKGNMKQECDIKDHYPEHWISFDHKEKKIDLRDVTFTIPVSYDHNDRRQNLELNVCLLQKSFDTQIIIGEQGSNKFSYMNLYCIYTRFEGMTVFHRTRMLNVMAKTSRTPIVANWDADVAISPVMIWDAVNRIRNGADCVYPYDGRFARVERLQWFKAIEKHLDVGIFGKKQFKGTNKETDKMSVGGAVFFNKEKFFEGGAENEKFITYGPEDAERFERFTKIGFNVQRVQGILYHIDHWCGVNSSTSHNYIENNRREWKKVEAMPKEELIEYIKTFNWTK